LEPKDLITVITDENIDKSQTSSESDLDAEQDSDSEFQSQTVVNSLAPVDWRHFNSKKYEVLYPWLYFSENKNGYLWKYCELFNPSSTLKCIGEGVKLGTHPTRKLEIHDSSSRHKESLMSKSVNVYRQLQTQNENVKEFNRGIVKICKEGRPRLSNDQLTDIVEDFKSKKSRKLARLKNSCI
jgi:hypothetical protein